MSATPGRSNASHAAQADDRARGDSGVHPAATYATSPEVAARAGRAAPDVPVAFGERELPELVERFKCQHMPGAAVTVAPLCEPSRCSRAVASHCAAVSPHSRRAVCLYAALICSCPSGLLVSPSA